MYLNKDPESWSKVSAKAVSEASKANIFNVLEMALQDIARLAEEVETLKADRDRTARNRDMWKGQCERQAYQLRSRRKKG